MMRRAVIEAVPDPDQPNRTIRRQRVYDPLRRLLEVGSITQPHWLAAERFRDCYALAEGAREGTGGRLEAWQRCHYAQRVADARQEVRGSLQAVGLRLSAVFVAAVIQQQPVRQMERELSMPYRSGPDRIAEALEILAAWQAGQGR
jgi:hypothetical protein